MRAVAFERPGAVAVRERPAPVAAVGEALVAPRWVGLCGTDLELLDGSMPYFAQGAAAYPLQPGHEIAGVVVQAPPGGPAPGTEVVVHPVVACATCAACRAGRACTDVRTVGVRHGMPGGAAELICVPAANLHSIPSGLGLREAVLAEPGVTALEAVERSGAGEGTRALVVGPGTLGALAAQLLRARGAQVDVLVADAGRGPFVERLGARPVVAATDGAYDAVVEAAGSAGAVHAALAAAAPGATVVLVGVQRGPLDGVDVNALVLKDLTLRAVGGPGDFPAVLALLASGAVDAEALVDEAFALEDAAAAFARLADATRPRPKVLLRIDGGDG